MKWAQYLNILNSVRAKTLQAKLDLFFKLMDNDGNGQLSHSEIKYLCSESLKKLLPNSNEDFIDDLASTFTKFVFQAVGLDLNEEIDVEILKNFMVHNTQSEEVDLLLMMCCAEKNPDEKFFEDDVKTNSCMYFHEANDNNLKQKGEYFSKEENRLKKLLQYQPENKKLIKRASVIQNAKALNFEKEREKYDEEKIEQKKNEENLMEKLKLKAEERKTKLIKYGGEAHDAFEEAFSKMQMQVLGKKI